MEDNKISKDKLEAVKKLKKDLDKKSKRRAYMRKYYQRKKAGKIKVRSKKECPKFSIKRGEYIVVLE